MSDAIITSRAVGFAPEEIDLTASTRTARLKWAVVVNDALPAGRAVNAAVCVAAATSNAVTGILGDDAVDTDGQVHPGLPWAGCSILVADAAALRTIRDRAASADGCFVADMPAVAQQTRVYTDYLAAMKETEVEYYAVSIIGPRNRVNKIVGGLPLMP
ncbi:DUF2000 domain-containing protein [Nonomuraea angiospora]|uniref:DUF2000 domain-containing protein n=1 Tax=Nonomuraea angiospora TaxID=46172 RepID=UPI00341EBAC4